jgi:hypothetical protein
VNGFSSRWKSGAGFQDPTTTNGDHVTSARKLKKKRQYTRKLEKDDFKAIVLKAGVPDLVIVIEAKLSLKKMISLPGFIRWCENMKYRYISLSFSASVAKGGAGYAGVMTLCKFKPIVTCFDLNNTPSEEARVVTHEFPAFVPVSVYSPCTGYDIVKMQARVHFDASLKEHLLAMKTVPGNLSYVQVTSMSTLVDRIGTRRRFSHCDTSRMLAEVFITLGVHLQK